MKRGTIFLGLIVSLCPAVRAQQTPKPQPQGIPKFELGGGYSYLGYYSSSSASSLKMNGWIVSADYNIFRWLGAAADFSGTYNTLHSSSNPFSNNIKTNIYSAMAGPRIFPFGHRRFITPFGHVLFGGSYIRISAPPLPPVPGFTQSDKETSWIAGGGLDWRITKHWALRAPELGFFHTKFFGGHPSQNSFRISAGMAFRFGQKHESP